MARLIVVDPESPQPDRIAAAAAVLRAGGLVAFPTETVYGLGADAFDAAAVARVFAAKGRPADDPIIVHVSGIDDLAGIAASIPPVAVRLAAAFWPGPLTIVVPRGPRVPDVVTAGLDSVAVRAPSHPVARALLAAAGTPIAAPSANPFGRTSPTTAAHVLADLGDRIDVVLDGGPAPVGVESTVVDCRADPPRVLRPGGVTLEALRRVVPGILSGNSETAQGGEAAAGASPSLARSPGMTPRHYAPRAPLVLVEGPDDDVLAALDRAARVLATSGFHVGILAADEDLVALAGTGGSVVIGGSPGAGGSAGTRGPADIGGSAGAAERVDEGAMASSGGPAPGNIHVRALGPLTDAAAVARRLFGALRELDAGGVTVILARDFGAGGLGLAVRDRLTRAAEGRVVRVGAGEGQAAADAIVARAGVTALSPAGGGRA